MLTTITQALTALVLIAALKQINAGPVVITADAAGGCTQHVQTEIPKSALGSYFGKIVRPFIEV